MYTDFFGLREKPFSLAPDPRFLFLSQSHREALAHVLYGIDQGEGFIAITGEVGMGKTTLCRTLLQRLGPDTEVAFVFNPTLSGEALLRAICAEFGLTVQGASRSELDERLNRFLLEMKSKGRRVLLIVDEAQNLAPATLEEIRLLSNLETSTSKLIQILLFGQPELDAKLDSDELRQLRQRISVRSTLDPLSAAETREYVRHRLRVASGGERELFTAAALREIQRRANGIPRLVNLLSDRALLAGYADGTGRIDADTVDSAAREILGARRRARGRRARWRRRGALAAALVVATLAGFALWWKLGPWDLGAWARRTAGEPAVSSPPAPRGEVGALAADARAGAALDPDAVPVYGPTRPPNLSAESDPSRAATEEGP